jgi:4,5-DOPA dioxygenase extradiol
MCSANSLLSTTVYVSHGGGPLPLLGDPGHQEMVDVLKKIADSITKPSAILVVSAHWEQPKPTLTAGSHPSLIYDYSGFPEESYEIQYPALGEPALASKISGLLKNQGIEAVLDEQRGFDHGLFVPLKIMYPEADIPCVQLSLINGLSPRDHIAMGKALDGLRKDNILVLGSGFSFHNMRAFFTPATPEIQMQNESFEKWLVETCSSQGFDEAERERRLIGWENAPAARFCHPREEHLLPLHVCYGFGAAPARQVFSFEVLGKQASAYLW